MCRYRIIVGLLVSAAVCGLLVNAVHGQSERDASAAYHKGKALGEQERYFEALAELETALRIYTRLQGADSLGVGSCCTQLGILHGRTGDYAKALSYSRRGLELYEAGLGKNHPNLVYPLIKRGDLYLFAGEPAEAVPHYLRAMRLREADVGKNHRTVIEILNNLALAYEEMFEYGKAEAALQRCIQDASRHLSNDDPLVGEALNSLATLYARMGQPSKSVPLLQRSLKIREAKFGKDDPHNVASSLHNLFKVHLDMGQEAKAEAYLRRCLQIREAKLGRTDLAVARTLYGLAELHYLRGQYAEAESVIQRGLRIREEKAPQDTESLANSYWSLGIVNDAMARYAKAEDSLQRTLRFLEIRHASDSPVIARIHHDLGWNLARQKETARATLLVQKARQATSNHFAKVLPGLSEMEQASLLGVDFDKSFHKALSLGWSARTEAGSASAEWLLNGKAIRHQALAEQYILARDAQDPKAKQMVQDLQQTRASLAALINRGPSAGLEQAFQRELQALNTREQALAQKLARAVGRPYRANPWVTLDELRARLGPKTAFVDIARFAVHDFTKDQDIGPRYVAWITPPPGKGDVQLIDLSEAEPIDRLVAETRKTLIDSANTITKVGEIEASAVLQKPLQALSAKVLHPLLPTLEKYEEWIISPDGALWLTPWNALLLKDDKFAVEKHLIRHVVSGRDLVLELPSVKPDGAYIFADPDYDLSPSKVIAVGGLRGGATSLAGQRLHGAIGSWKVSFEFLDREVVIRDEENNGATAGKGTWKQQGNVLTIQTARALFQGTIEANEIRGQRSVREDNGKTSRDAFRMEFPSGSGETRPVGSLGTLPRVPRLPGTAQEAEAIRPKLQQWLGQEPKMFLEEKASEAMVKALKHPRVLTLATHGYFLPTQEVNVKDRPGLDLDNGKRSAALFDKKGHPIENPLLRCGLLLAGCNQRAEAKAGEDDGILTGLEIVGIDLNGCELVVLSACETALGDVRSGEGVAGLRQAFQLAGAKAVLASLWQVPDRETALLMNAFYGELAKGKTQTAALRQAQLQRIAARRAQFGSAHPFFWSAFALTSRGSD